MRKAAQSCLWFANAPCSSSACSDVAPFFQSSLLQQEQNCPEGGGHPQIHQAGRNHAGHCRHRSRSFLQWLCRGRLNQRHSGSRFGCSLSRAALHCQLPEKSEKCQCERGKNKHDFSSPWFFKVELWIWRI